MIEIYSVPGCGHCNDLKEFLAKKEINFITHDCSVDAEAATYIVDKTQQSNVPITVFYRDTSKEHVVIGFNEDVFESILQDYVTE